MGRLFTKITGVASCIPEKVLDNDFFSNYLDTSDEWIQKRTGIQKRHIINNESVCDMAYRCALSALKTADLPACKIQMILVATSTPDNAFPSVAASVQSMLNIENCFSMDVSAACSGFVYALDVAQQYFKNETVQYALVIGVDALSRFLNWEDRKTCILFGDAAGCFVLQTKHSPGIIDSKIKNIIHKTDLLKLQLFNAKETQKKLENPFIEMDGQAVFRLAVQKISEITQYILEKNNLKMSDLDWLIPHQANTRILDAIAKKCGLPHEKIINNIKEQGNTSAASIPVAFDNAIQLGKIQRDHLIALVAIGGGVTLGANLLYY